VLHLFGHMIYGITLGLLGALYALGL